MATSPLSAADAAWLEARREEIRAARTLQEHHFRNVDAGDGHLHLHGRQACSCNTALIALVPQWAPALATDPLFSTIGCTKAALRLDDAAPPEFMTARRRLHGRNVKFLSIGGCPLCCTCAACSQRVLLVQLGQEGDAADLIHSALAVLWDSGERSPHLHAGVQHLQAAVVAQDVFVRRARADQKGFVGAVLSGATLTAAKLLKQEADKQRTKVAKQLVEEDAPAASIAPAVPVLQAAAAVRQLLPAGVVPGPAVLAAGAPPGAIALPAIGGAGTGAVASSPAAAGGVLDEAGIAAAAFLAGGLMGGALDEEGDDDASLAVAFADADAPVGVQDAVGSSIGLAASDDVPSGGHLPADAVFSEAHAELSVGAAVDEVDAADASSLADARTAMRAMVDLQVEWLCGQAAKGRGVGIVAQDPHRSTFSMPVVVEDGNKMGFVSSLVGGG